MLKFLCNTENMYKNINKYKIECKVKMKEFFHKSLTKNMGVCYTWQNMVIYIFNILSIKYEILKINHTM